MTEKIPLEKNIREWRNEDKITGVFIVGRSEEWWNNQSFKNSNKPEQRKKKQMEILHANTEAGVVQVIRTQLVTKSSSKNNNTRVLQVDPSSKLETLLARNLKNVSLSDKPCENDGQNSLIRVSSVEDLNSDFISNNNYLSRVSSSRRSLPNSTNASQKFMIGIKCKGNKVPTYDNVFPLSSHHNDINGRQFNTHDSDIILNDNNSKGNLESLVILKHLNTIKSLKPDEPKTKASKRVEFSKTEVHFTPDSGKIEIIETEGKPVRNLNLRKGRRVNRKPNNVNAEISSTSHSKRNYLKREVPNKSRQNNIANIGRSGNYLNKKNNNNVMYENLKLKANHASNKTSSRLRQNPIYENVKAQ